MKNRLAVILINHRCVATALALLIVAHASASNVAPPSSISNPSSTTAAPQWGGLPPGSYTQTCSTTKILNGTSLSGMCRAIDGTERLTRLDDFQFCDGDIWNNNGQLGCNKSDKSSRFKAAATALTDASLTVLGRAPVGTGIELGSEIRKWIKLMYSKYGMRQQYEAGLKGGDALTMLQTYLAEMENGSLRAEVVDRAYREALGYSPDIGESVIVSGQMQAKKTWYQMLVLSLSTDPQKRKAMLELVYRTTMGRGTEPPDRDFWLTRTETYRQILEANRKWLYSQNGANDLDKTARRAAFWWYGFEQKNNPLAKPVDFDKPENATFFKDKAEKALPGYKAKRLIFIEMIGGNASMNYREYLRQNGFKVGEDNEIELERTP